MLYDLHPFGVRFWLGLGCEITKITITFHSLLFCGGNISLHLNRSMWNKHENCIYITFFRFLFMMKLRLMMKFPSLIYSSSHYFTKATLLWLKQLLCRVALKLRKIQWWWQRLLIVSHCFNTTITKLQWDLLQMITYDLHDNFSSVWYFQTTQTFMCVRCFSEK